MLGEINTLHKKAHIIHKKS